MTTTAPTTNWALIGPWLLAFLGFPIGGGLTYLIIGAIDSPLKGAAGGALAGAVIGGAQWLALRRTHDVDARWVGWTSAGLAVGIGLSTALVGTKVDSTSLVTRAAITGLIWGAAQSYALRHRSRVAIIWALTVAIAYTIAWPVTGLVIKDNLQMGYVVFGSSGAILFQLLTLIVLSQRTTKQP